MKKGPKKLTPAEAQRLEQFVEKNGGQFEAVKFFGCTIGTLSRTTNRRTGPSPMLRDKLVENGIIKGD